MTQLLIAIIGGAAIVLALSNDRGLRLSGCICGLLGQPLWIWTTWQSGEWGMFGLSLAYTAIWAHGVKKNWRRA